MANFHVAYYRYVKPNEGGYINHPNDKGGETYAGIARNFFPNEKIWSFIDAVKKERPIKRNEIFPEIENDVVNFYKRLWEKNRFDEINSQLVANLLFDYFVHSGANAIKAVQRIIGVHADGKMGNKTIAAINSKNENDLFQSLLKQRETFLRSLAEKAGQHVFLSGWMNRINKFWNDFYVSVKPLGNTMLLFIIIALIVIVLWKH